MVRPKKVKVRPLKVKVRPLKSMVPPVTPEVAGSSLVGPTNLKLSCAATSRRFVFSEGRLENWRLTKSVARSRFSRANFERTATKIVKCSRFRRECSTEKRVTSALESEREARARPGEGYEAWGIAWCGLEREQRRASAVCTSARPTRQGHLQRGGAVCGLNQPPSADIRAWPSWTRRNLTTERWKR